MNYTYFNKLKNICNMDIEDIHSFVHYEKYFLENRVKDSLWEDMTDAAKEYLNILEQIRITFFKKDNKDDIKRIINREIKKFDYKIRVVLFAYEYSTFPTLQSLYTELKKDGRFICELVHIPFFHPNKTTLENELSEYYKNGINDIIPADKYNILNSSPDVAVFIKGYDLVPKKFFSTEIDKLVDKTIFIPYGMETDTSDYAIKCHFQLPIHNTAWKCLTYCTKMYNDACKYSLQKGKNFWPIGHTRFDLKNMDLTDNKYYKEIKKLSKGRKIVLYNAHFTINEGDNSGTFKKYGLDILKYFANRNDIFLIYRPHPLLYGTLKKEYDNNKEFWKIYNELTSNYENIFLDNNSNYLVAFHISDLLISDRSSLIPEYAIYCKPIIYLKKENSSGFKNPELEAMLYSCDNKEQIFEHLERLLLGNDILAKTRKEDICRVFMYDQNEMVSTKIIQLMVNHYIEGENNE